MPAVVNAVFIESTGFTARVCTYLTDEAYARLQQDLMGHPTMGSVLRGCGGLRKVRTPDAARGRGKRGGARVIYLYLPPWRWFLMLDINGKREKDDLSAGERRALARLAGDLRREALKIGVRVK